MVICCSEEGEGKSREEICCVVDGRCAAVLPLVLLSSSVEDDLGRPAACSLVLLSDEGDFGMLAISSLVLLSLSDEGVLRRPDLEVAVFWEEAPGDSSTGLGRVGVN
mmetsp:Transcript_7534/g.9918  ORF Transcript_7534/g.9918 Transcript_7534/m.9918 type:complete len:107 (+) Transcript_7534:463-783(+)